MQKTRTATLAALLVSVTLAGCTTQTAADPEAESAARGAAIAEARCAACHAVGLTGVSPAPPAPVWREMAEANDLDQLGRRMAEGKLIHRSGTVSMPEFTLTPDEIGSVIAYMKTLRAG